MGYVGVKGGKDAIQNAELLVDYYRLKDTDTPLPVSEIKNQLRLAVDRVMSEGSLYDRDVAAIALKQSEGDVLEASYLVRAYRSTLPRLMYSNPVSSRRMFLVRRISSAFQNIPWGQVLGASRDYSQRLVNFSLKDEGRCDLDPPLKKNGNYMQDSNVPKVIDYLRSEGLLEEIDSSFEHPEPYDITRQPVTMPMERSGRLQRLSRGEEGSVLSFGYASMRGWGSVHPTLAEVRVGYMPVCIEHPYWDTEVEIGSVLATEVDAICKFSKSTDPDEKAEYKFSLGYGFVFGFNDKKAIAMAILDRALTEGGDAPTRDQEFVLLHIDGMESQGFISHLKLPHYVTFQSALDRMRRMKATAREESEEKKGENCEHVKQL